MRSALRLTGQSLFLLLAAACGTPPDATGPTGGAAQAASDIIPGRYIVVMKP